MEIKVVERSPLIETEERGWSRKRKWIPLFESLDPEKAIEILLPTRKKAEKQRKSIHGSLRNGRSVLKIHTRVFPAQGQWKIYIWRDEKEPFEDK